MDPFAVPKGGKWPPDMAFAMALMGAVIEADQIMGLGVAPDYDFPCGWDERDYKGV